MWVGLVLTTVNSVVAILLANGQSTYKVFILAIGFGGYVYRNCTVWNGSGWSGFLNGSGSHGEILAVMPYSSFFYMCLNTVSFSYNSSCTDVHYIGCRFNLAGFKI